MNEKSITKNAFYSFLKSFMSLIFPLITFPYASRVLLPDGIGRINFASSVLSYFGFLATLGITSYGIREASKIKHDKEALSKFTKEILTINAISTAISFLLFIFLLFSVSKFKEYTSLLLIFSVPVLLTMFSMDWFFNALEEFRYITLRSVLFQFSSLLILFLLVKTKDDCEWYAVMGIFGTSCSAICNFLYSRKFIDYKIKVKLELKKHMKPILTFFGMSVVSCFYCVLDTTMLGFLSNDTQVGFYTAATKMNKMIITLITSVLAVLLPRLSNYQKNNDKNNFYALTQKSFSISLLLSIPIATGLFLLAKPSILLLSGPQYLPAITPMIIMLPLFLIITTATLTGCQILPAINKEKIALYSYIIGAITNFSTNALLIPKYGCIGAAIGTITAETAVTIFQLFFTYKYIFSKQTLRNLIQALSGSIFMGLVVYFFRNLFNNYLFQFIICTFIGMVTYFLFLLIFKNEFIGVFMKTVKSKIFTKAENSSSPDQVITEQSKKVSVLMATYNGENFIREQLDSILNQTYKNFDILICDDNSKDKTFDIASEYSQKYENIKVYKNDSNLGFRKNFEKLVLLSDGDLLAFSDQDDIWETNKLEICIQNLGDKSFVCTNSKLVDSSGKSLNYTMQNVIRCHFIPDDNTIQLKHLFHQNFVQGSTMLAKADFIKRYTPIPDLFKFHDWWFAFNATFENGIKYLPECTLNYRQHTTQVTLNKSDPFLYEIFNLNYVGIDDYYTSRIQICEYFLNNSEKLSEEIIEYIKETKQYFSDMMIKKNKNSFTYYKKYYDLIWFDKNLFKKILRLEKRRLGVLKDKLSK